MEKIRKPRGKAVVQKEMCIACGAKCEAACKVRAITMNEVEIPIIDQEKCNGCLKCIKICPSDAISLYLTEEEKKQLELWKQQRAQSREADEEEEVDTEELERRKRLAPYKDVWVFIEQTEGIPANVSWELLGEGAKLAAKLSVKLCAVVIGESVEQLCQDSIAFGAERVYRVDAPVFKNYRTQAYRRALNQLIKKYKPEIVLMGATSMGRDLAGAVATDVKTGLTADCTGLDIDKNNNLMQTRPAFGGNIMATIMCDQFRPQMATVRPNVMDMPEKNEDRTGEVIEETIEIEENSILTKVIEIIREKSQESANIAGAEIIVSGGSGMINSENFSILHDLAREVKGVVGASRRAVDAGWMPHSRQVGQTGTTVRPKVYIACGISGAIQHLVGMQDSDVIIAINRDRNAPIFEVATYGIVGDLFEIIPAITEEIRNRRQHRKSA
ncbi:electron transfer flavoprotein subunit alpha [bacterium]|nr:electron transfer flavoprotein subunit alpha [bacterium]